LPTVTGWRDSESPSPKLDGICAEKKHLCPKHHLELMLLLISGVGKFGRIRAMRRDLTASAITADVLSLTGIVIF